MHPPINGTEQRLDVLIAEIQALRGLLELKPTADEAPAPEEPDVIPLREPARPRGKPKKNA